MNLKEWAEEQGVAYVTARRWFAAGKLPVPAYRVGGLILIGEPVSGAKNTGSTVVYARVSSADQRLDLDRQVATIVVEHRDRFARFGAEYVEASLAASGRRLLVVGPATSEDSS